MSTTKMVEHLIVDFPTHRNRSSRSVRFDKTSELYIVQNEDINRHDLWYDKSDYSRMKRAIKKSARKVRTMTSAGVPVSYSGGGGSSDDCLIGIEHLLTPATVLDVKTCRRRCTRAVLQEQARQAMNASDRCGWDDIANASLVETRRTAFRARQLGKLHRESI